MRSKRKSFSALQENFSFEKGHLLYGLDKYRQLKRTELMEKYLDDRQLQGTDSQALTVDHYNNITLYRVLDEDFNYDANTELENEFLEWIKKTENTQLKEKEILKHLDAIKNVAIHPKLSLTNNLFSKNDDHKEDRKIKRACKARLAHEDTIIHFLLDGLDARHIFSKEYSKNNSQKKNECLYDSFTSSEFRFVLKYYDAIEHHVKFYYNDNEIKLTDWLSEQSLESKSAILEWFKFQQNKNKNFSPSTKLTEAINKNAEINNNLSSPISNKIAHPTAQKANKKQKEADVNNNSASSSVNKLNRKLF